MLGGALVSQGVLDEGVMEHFPPGGAVQMEYGDVPLAPLLWLDDIINGVEQDRFFNETKGIVPKPRKICLYYYGVKEAEEMCNC